MNGLAHGHGIKLMADGTKYMGQWQDGKPVDYGIKVLADGTQIKGFLVDGEFFEEKREEEE